MKRILVFIDWYEPAFRAGGPVRSMVNLVARLREHYRFSIVTSAFDYGSVEPMPGVPLNTWTSGKNQERVCYQKKSGLFSALRHIKNEQPDLVYLQGIFSLRYSLLPLLAAQLCRKTVVLAPRGMLHPTALNFKGTQKRIFLRAAHALGLFRKVRFQAVDNYEAAYIQKVFPRARVFRATNMAALPNALSPLERNPETPLQLVSVARISPEKNNRFILQLLHKFPHPVHMVFYGAAGNDEAYVSAFRRDMEQLPPHIAVQWHGFLDPERLQPELRQAHWFIMPTLGENFGHAIFEALAAGLPVMIGDNTPWKNLQDQNAGWDLSPQNPEPWLRMLETAYYMERDRYQTMSADAMKLAQAQAASDTAFGQYELLFKA